MSAATVVAEARAPTVRPSQPGGSRPGSLRLDRRPRESPGRGKNGTNSHIGPQDRPMDGSMPSNLPRIVFDARIETSLRRLVSGSKSHRSEHGRVGGIPYPSGVGGGS
jgi:hypothetical protein